MASKSQGGGLADELPLDRLASEAMGLGKALVQHGIGKLNGGPGVSDVVKGAGNLVADNPVKGGAEMLKGGGKAAGKAAAGKVKDSVGGALDAVTPNGSKDSEPDLKVTNIVESVDVPVPRQVAYEEWTRFEEFPTFMKKVENVKQEDDDVVTWKAQIFWSHRTWKATIVDQVPPERIVWNSEADKGRVDGAVTFHELAPDLTRVLVSLEYHPQGLFEKTGNIWRAQGRRVRAELKHFRRHVANHTLIHQDDVDGWTGEIHDGDVDENPNGSKQSSSGSPAKKSPAKKSTAKKSTAKKSATKKSTAKTSSPAKKSSSARSSSTAKKAPAKKTPAKKTPAKKTAAAKAPAKKSSARKAPAKKSPAKKAPAKSTARRSTAKKSTSRRGSRS